MSQTFSTSVGWTEDDFRSHPGPLLFAVVSFDPQSAAGAPEPFQVVARLEAPFNVGEPWARAQKKQLDKSGRLVTGIMRLPDLDATDEMILANFASSMMRLK